MKCWLILLGAMISHAADIHTLNMPLCLRARESVVFRILEVHSKKSYGQTFRICVHIYRSGAVRWRRSRSRVKQSCGCF